MNIAPTPPSASTSPDTTPHVNPAVAVKSILALWAFYYVLNTMRMARSSSATRTVLLIVSCVSTAVGNR